MHSVNALHCVHKKFKCNKLFVWFFTFTIFFISSYNIHTVSSPQCVHNNFKCNVLLVWFLAKILEYAVKFKNPTTNMINEENLDSKILDVV